MSSSTVASTATAATRSAAPAVRRHDLDWLRAFAILALLFFHSAMPYAADSPWHIRNAESSSLLLELNFFVSRFRMALLFVVAGVASQFLLRRRSVRQFLSERAKRLLVPLTFGIFVIVPPQIYFERLAQGRFDGSYLAFWPRVLSFVPYPQGDFSYHHLWFIWYLFVYGILLAPVILFVRSARGAAVLDRVRGFFGRHGVHLMALPIVLTYAALIPRFSGAQDIVHDGAMFLVYFLYFVFGWLIGNDATIWKRIENGRQRAFTAAVLALLFVNAVRWNHARPPEGLSLDRAAWLAFLAVNAWCWVITILGYGHRWLNFDHPILGWAREASYPFYVLHQTVIVVIAYYVVQTPEPVIAKFLFTSFASLAVTLALYQTLVRPYNWVRWLFGMAPRATALLLASLCLWGSELRAQGSESSRSAVIGGVVTAQSTLVLGKLGVEHGRWAVVADITRDDTRQQWVVDGSRGEYVLWGYSAHLRHYSRLGGRGFYVEGGAGAARATLRVTELDGTVRQRVATIPLAAWGLGYRTSRRGHPWFAQWFAEFGYRNSTPLASRHLYVDAVPPAGSRDDLVTYRSWWFESGRSSGQLYAGIGRSF